MIVLTTPLSLLVMVMTVSDNLCCSLDHTHNTKRLCVSAQRVRVHLHDEECGRCHLDILPVTMFFEL